MQVCEVLEQHKKITGAMAGTWNGDEKLYPSPWDSAGGAAKGRLSARVDLDGFFVITDYQQERGGAVTYRGHGVYGWDPNLACYTMNWFDSMGGGCATAARGTWAGNTLTFTQESPMGHGRYTYTFESPMRMLFRIDMSQDGKNWAPFMESVFTKA